MDTITDYPKASGDSKTSDCKTSNELISPSSSSFFFSCCWLASAASSLLRLGGKACYCGRCDHEV